MKLMPVTKENLELVRQWRNDCMESLRTPYMLTKDQQEEFYVSLCSRNSPHRYYELWHDGGFVGLGGITYIQWENRCGEISLILTPDCRGQGLGQKAVAELFRHAFDELNLNMVSGECYNCNPKWGFWVLVTTKYDGYVTHLKQRKFWGGKYYDSLYFSVTKEQYENPKQPVSADT
jgi:RimJ/RimL family protein N-acetyltransferase